ncbi:MAG: hypothetical protein RL325_1823 [Planctomycetota bacterium]
MHGHARKDSEKAMADETPTSDPAAGRASKGAAPAPGGVAQLVKDSWQVPAVVAAMVAIAGAAWYARTHRAPNQWEEALAQAEEQIERHELAIARQVLEEVIAPNIAQAPEGFAPRFEAARADLLAEELAAEPDATPDSHAAVAKAYEAALAAGAELDEEQFGRYASALLGAGREKDAIAIAEKTGDAGAAQKLAARFGRRDLQQAYDAASAADSTARTVDAFFEKYEDFRSEPGIRAEDRAWAAALAARVRLAGGHSGAAVERLLVELPRAQAAVGEGESVSDAQFAELWYLLGEGFRREQKFIDAEHALVLGHGLVPPSVRLAGEIDLALGLTKLALDRAEEAHAVLDRAVLIEHPADIRPALVLARARARASLGRTEDALLDFDSMVGLAEKRKLAESLEAETIDVLRELARSALGESRLAEAIAYAERATAFGDRGPAGAESMLVLAESAYRRAREDRERELERAGDASAIEPGTRAEINRLFKRAGESFAAYLRTASAQDLPATARSDLHLSAADAFDCGGDAGSALTHFEQSLALLPESDSKRTERLLRIGDIHAHARDHDKAREAYEAVYRITHNDPRVAMPLCKVLVAGGDIPRALAELRKILEGHAGLRPDSQQYLEALELFARLSATRGDHAAAAERLAELIERDPQSPALGERHFRLAQSLQQLGQLAGEESRHEDLTAARRAQLERMRAERTLESQRAFQHAIEALEARGRALDGLGRDMLRNAYLQRAHCAFDRGELKEAIEYYETVDRKFPEEAASVLALVQIVNAADRLGDAPRAEAAHLRALRRIESLPEEALLGDGGVLGREDWKNWLRNHPPGRRVVASPEATP